MRKLELSFMSCEAFDAQAAHTTFSNLPDCLETLDMRYGGLTPAHAPALAEALEFMAVLTNLNLSSNNLAGKTEYINASEVEGDSKEVGATVMYQGREMTVSQGIDDDGELKLADYSGVHALAGALKFNAVLTKLDVRFNIGLGDEGKKALGDAARGRECFELLI